MNKKKAFTLAEILITLMIIGIIAVLTIPNLIAKHNAATLKSQFNKSYTVITNVGNKIAYDRPDFHTDLLNANKKGGYGGLIRETSKELEKHLKVKSILNCNQAPKYKNYYGAGEAWGIHCYSTFIVLDDGSFVFPATWQAMSIGVDINGAKKPNKQGHDLFIFQVISSGKIVPTAYYFCIDGRLTDKGQGLGCTKQAILNPNYFKNLPN